MSRVAVDGRHLALPIEAYDDLTTWGQSNDAWITVAEDLAEQSICRALTRAGLSERDLDAIFFVSVTGIASPSIDARLMNRMNLRTDIKRNPIFGLGCVAGAAGIARAADYVRAYPDHNAVLVSVELCSLTWQRRNLSVANLISSGLFGDGSAAVIVSAERNALLTAPRSSRSMSSFLSRHRRRDGVGHFGSRASASCCRRKFRHMVRKHLAQDVDGFLPTTACTRDDISTWIMHTGGPKVLEATAQSLDLPDGALAGFVGLLAQGRQSFFGIGAAGSGESS